MVKMCPFRKTSTCDSGGVQDDGMSRAVTVERFAECIGNDCMASTEDGCMLMPGMLRKEVKFSRNEDREQDVYVSRVCPKCGSRILSNDCCSNHACDYYVKDK